MDIPVPTSCCRSSVLPRWGLWAIMIGMVLIGSYRPRTPKVDGKPRFFFTEKTLVLGVLVGGNTTRIWSKVGWKNGENDGDTLWTWWKLVWFLFFNFFSTGFTFVMLAKLILSSSDPQIFLKKAISESQWPRPARLYLHSDIKGEWYEKK